MYVEMLYTHRQIFSKSYQIKPKSDCIQYFQWIWNQTEVRLVPNQSENGAYNLISVRFNKRFRKDFCVCCDKWSTQHC